MTLIFKVICEIRGRLILLLFYYFKLHFGIYAFVQF